MPPKAAFLAPSVIDADVAVIVVSHNVRDLVIRNLEALLASEGEVRIRLILVDNASKDGTIAAVAEQFPLVQLIANPWNAGFAHAVNQGIAIAQSRHVLLLNPDMRVNEATVSALVAYADAHPEVGVVGGKLLTEDGQPVPHVRRFPDVWSQFALILKLPHLFPRLVARYRQTELDVDREQDVDSIRGSLFLMTQNALQRFRGLDSRYFIFFEEVDFCRQVVEGGMSVRYVPSITAIDYVGRSFAQKTRYWSQAQFTKSMIQYFEKWQPRWQAWLLQLVRPLGLLGTWLLDRWRAL